MVSGNGRRRCREQSAARHYSEIVQRKSKRRSYANSFDIPFQERSEARRLSTTLWPMATFSKSPSRRLWPSLPSRCARSLPRSQPHTRSRCVIRSPALRCELPIGLGRRWSLTRYHPPEFRPAPLLPHPHAHSTCSMPARVSHGSQQMPRAAVHGTASRATRGSILSLVRPTSRRLASSRSAPKSFTESRQRSLSPKPNLASNSGSIRKQGS